MKTIKTLVVCTFFLAALWSIPSQAQAGGGRDGRILAANIYTVLEPGVWHGWGMGPSSDCGAYIVETNPLRPGAEGDVVETAIVQPEFDGTSWNDVLRVRIPDDQPALRVNLRVYRTCNLPVVMEFEEVLEAGAWMGWVVGPASVDRAYLVEVTPLEPSSDGAYIEKALVQQEYFQGEWKDVLRLQSAAGFPDLRVQVRVYAIERAPMVVEFATTLQPGEPTRFYLGQSADIGWYAVEMNPIEPPEAGEFVERVTIQPMVKGTWEDMLLLQAVADQPPITVKVRVYYLGAREIWIP